MGTVSKALDLLDLFTRTRPQIGLSDLARLGGLNKATCYRLLTELCDHGLIEQIGSAREYRLGPTLLRLSALREAHVPTREAAMPVLQTLANSTGETAHLTLLMGQTLRPLAHAYSNAHTTRVTIEDTDSFPFHATSSGLATLAFQPESFCHAVLDAPMPRLTDLTVTRKDLILAKLETIRSLGLAENRGSYEIDVHSIAAPLFDAFGRCTGAVSVAALASRMTEQQRNAIRQALVQAGFDITTLWGGCVPPAVAAIWRSAA